ncbi:MAG TPA: sodium:proton antiporter [Gemmatimonadaceae bacterium]|jgi:CPA1 family monovalent cation:H+ antiporter|nr:sodium:proton antiporter [Gemmatimonadaceae bacterium]
MTAEHSFIVLFSIASAVAIAVSRTRVPYTVALVVVGLGVGALHIIEPPRLTKELLFSLFLPGLIFEAAYNIHAAELRRSWRAVATLAGPGVIVSIVVAGFASSWALRVTGLSPEFAWRDGLVFAALVSATDPVAVVGLFRKLGLDVRLTTLVEAESLFNDGTSIVALTLILAFVGGEASSVAGLAARFVLVVCGGAAIGTAMAYVIVRVTRHIDDPMIEITLTTIAAYGSFALAEDLHASGVIATVAAGLMLGTTARESAFTPQTRVAADAFWQYVAFALNSVVFLLIGFEVQPATLLRTAGVVAVGFVVVMLARVIVVYGTTGLLRRTSERLSPAWSALIAWGGLRGALAMVLALALPAGFRQRALLIDMTFGVVVASLLVQGLTIPFLATRLVGPPDQVAFATPAGEERGDG